MLMSYKGNHKRLTNSGITVTCANRGQLISTATGIINFQGIPTPTKNGHKFPNNKLVDPLLSLGKLTEHSCNVNFTKNTVEVTNCDGITILVGQKPIGRNIYTLPLPIGKTQQVPKDIPHQLQFITHAAVTEDPKICGVNGAPASANKVEHEVPVKPEYGVFHASRSTPRLEKPGLGDP